ncbi:MAG: RNase H family protein [Candidatus Bilamarchaeaceae archaeon]
MTVYTDGAWRPLLHIGAYAYCIKTQKNKKIQNGGIIRGESLNADIAEFSAFIKAIQFLVQKKMLNDRNLKNTVNVYTDSLRLTIVYEQGCIFPASKRLCWKIREIKRRYGHLINIHWAPRNSIEEQKACDLFCKKLIKKYEQ